jgi:branched-subunit amino acid aminotransferase/4-amino-4-deoxychorismate lyase
LRTEFNVGMTTLWLNGQIVDAAEARVSALSRGLMWGDGLFETIRVYDGVPFALDGHLERMRAGAELLDLAIPGEPDLRAAIAAVVASESLTDCAVRLTITRGAGPADSHADATEAPDVVVTAWPLRDYEPLYRDGAALVALRGWGRPLHWVKTTSYAASIAARVAARRANGDDALFVASDGLVLEASGSNLFAVFGDEIQTPPVGDGVLPGVTRGIVVDIAAQLGLRCREEPLWLDDLWTADEVVCTSSLREVYFVRSIDERSLPNAGIAARLRERYRAVVTSGSSSSG